MFPHAALCFPAPLMSLQWHAIFRWGVHWAPISTAPQQSIVIAMEQEHNCTCNHKHRFRAGCTLCIGARHRDPILLKKLISQIPFSALAACCPRQQLHWPERQHQQESTRLRLSPTCQSKGIYLSQCPRRRAVIRTGWSWQWRIVVWCYGHQWLTWKLPLM